MGRKLAGNAVRRVASAFCAIPLRAWNTTSMHTFDTRTLSHGASREKHRFMTFAGNIQHGDCHIWIARFFKLHCKTS
jgi:hypothetical protein